MPPRPKRARWRSRALRAAACLLLGAVTTVGVAWGIGSTLPDSVPLGDNCVNILVSNGSSAEMVALQSGPGSSMREVLRAEKDFPIAHVLDELPSRFTAVAEATLEARQADPPLPWALTPLGREVIAGGWGRWRRDEAGCTSIAAGWPFTAMWGYILWETGSNGPNSFTLAHYEFWLPGLWPKGSDPVKLPYLIAWPGFVLDTLFYAAPWWIVLFGPGAVKRSRRKRRGACLACGYDLRGLGDEAKCPECGT